MNWGKSAQTVPKTEQSENAAIAMRALRRMFKGGIEAVRDIDLTGPDRA